MMHYQENYDMTIIELVLSELRSVIFKQLLFIMMYSNKGG